MGRIDAEPLQLQDLETRLAAIHDLARKHRASANELPTVLVALASELNTLEHSDERLDSLTAKSARLEQRFRELSDQLTAMRTQAAGSLTEHVNANIRQLGMPNGGFDIAPYDDHGED